MTKVLALSLVFSALVATIQTARASVDRAVGCGGAPMKYGMTIGAVGPSRTKLGLRSVEAVAAVHPAGSSDTRPRAWVIWDERGMPWLALKKTSPSDLKQLWEFKDRGPDFTNYNFLRFTPVKLPLPKRYSLLWCGDVTPSF